MFSCALLCLYLYLPMFRFSKISFLKALAAVQRFGIICDENGNFLWQNTTSNFRGSGKIIPFVFERT